MSDPKLSEPIIELRQVTHHYGIRPILRNFSFAVHPGECVAVLGPNGMGKSTLLGLVGGVLSPVEGTVHVAGLIRRSTPEAELVVRRQLVYLPDEPWLPNLSLREFLVSLGEIYELPVQRMFDHIDRLIDLFELQSVALSPMPSYSAGQKKKAGLCAALLPEVPIMVLDEPFSGGLDPAGLTAVKHLLRRLTHDKGVTILFASPAPELIEQVASRVVVLQNGQILADGSLEQLREKTATDGPLSEVLTKLIHPHTQGLLERYFE